MVGKPKSLRNIGALFLACITNTAEAEIDKHAIIERARDVYKRLQTPGEFKNAQEILDAVRLIETQMDVAGTNISSLEPGHITTQETYEAVFNKVIDTIAKAVQDRMAEVPQVQIRQTPATKFKHEG